MVTYNEAKDLMQVLSRMHQEDLKLLAKCSGLDLKVYNSHNKRVIGILATYSLLYLLKENDLVWD